jgi:hypothetical protein
MKIDSKMNVTNIMYENESIIKEIESRITSTYVLPIPLNRIIFGYAEMNVNKIHFMNVALSPDLVYWYYYIVGEIEDFKYLWFRWWIVCNDYLELLQWYVTIYQININNFRVTTHMTRIYENGSINILKWILSNCDETFVEFVASVHKTANLRYLLKDIKDTKILDCLKEHYGDQMKFVITGIVECYPCLHYALLNGRIDIVEWFYQNFNFNYEDIFDPEFLDHMNSYKWVYRDNYQKIIQWLNQNKLMVIK